MAKYTALRLKMAQCLLKQKDNSTPVSIVCVHVDAQVFPSYVYHNKATGAGAITMGMYATCNHSRQELITGEAVTKFDC